MGSQMALSALTLSDLERSKSRALIFESVLSRKGAKLSPMLLITINRKPYNYGESNDTITFDVE